MQGPTHERLKLLCEQAAVEKDPDRFLRIIREINDMLEAKRSRLGGTDADSNPPSDSEKVA
jgi:hypothetical protein